MNTYLEFVVSNDKKIEMIRTRAGDDEFVMSELEEGVVDDGLDVFSGREVEFCEISDVGTASGDVCTGDENCI